MDLEPIVIMGVTAGVAILLFFMAIALVGSI